MLVMRALDAGPDKADCPVSLDVVYQDEALNHALAFGPNAPPTDGDNVVDNTAGPQHGRSHALQRLFRPSAAPPANPPPRPAPRLRPAKR